MTKLDLKEYKHCSAWEHCRAISHPGGGGGGGGGGYSLCDGWYMYKCAAVLTPFFSLWQDRARSFWGIFLIHQQQSYLLGYKNYPFLQKSIFLAPNSIFSSIFLGPIFSGQRHTPISFQAEYPPRVSHLYIRKRLGIKSITSYFFLNILNVACHAINMVSIGCDDDVIIINDYGMLPMHQNVIEITTDGYTF